MPHDMIAHTMRSLCTPAQHAQASQTKPVHLLALGIGPHSKTALLEAMALGYGPHIALREVLEEAAQAAKEGAGGASRCGAAGAFLHVMGEAVLYFAKHVDHRVELAEKIAGAERYTHDTTERRAIERAGFTERMRQGKAAARCIAQMQAGFPAARANERLQVFLKGMAAGEFNQNGGTQ